MQSRRKFLGSALAPAAVLAARLSPGACASEAAARDAADRARTKVVVLKTARSRGRGAATGFLARPGLVITAAHAVDPEAAVTAWVNGVSYRASLLLTDRENDLAVLALRAPELHLKPVSLALSSEDLRAGEELVVLAGPAQGARAMGDPAERVSIPAVYESRVLVPLPAGGRALMLKLDASVKRGDSGSPVLSVRDGSVVGVLSSRELPDATGVSRHAYAVPAEAVHPWLERAARRREQDDEEFYLRRILR